MHKCQYLRTDLPIIIQIRKYFWLKKSQAIMQQSNPISLSNQVILKKQPKNSPFFPEGYFLKKLLLHLFYSFVYNYTNETK